MTILETGLAGAKASSLRKAQDLKDVVSGKATIKDVNERKLAKVKGGLKELAKDTFIGAGMAAAATPVVGKLVFDNSIIKLPKFANEAIKKFTDTQAVKTIGNAITKYAAPVFETVGKQISKHPVAAMAYAGLVAVSSFIGYKSIYNLGKVNGKADQKYDDTVQIREQQQKEMPKLK